MYIDRTLTSKRILTACPAAEARDRYCTTCYAQIGQVFELAGFERDWGGNALEYVTNIQAFESSLSIGLYKVGKAQLDVLASVIEMRRLQIIEAWDPVNDYLPQAASLGNGYTRRKSKQLR